MFNCFKKTKITPKENRCDTFDDFIRMMIECSDEEFRNTVRLLARMRRKKYTESGNIK
jgi:hypothetical protein